MKTFKIYPFGHRSKRDKSAFYTVMLVDKKTLQSNHGKECTTCQGIINCEKALGLTHCHGGKMRIDTFGQVRGPKVNGEIGFIMLSEKDVNPEIISHECTHAMLYLVQHHTQVIYIGGQNFDLADEWMAQVQGALTGQIHEKIYLPPQDRE
jgi:hypothetical protein